VDYAPESRRELKPLAPIWRPFGISIDVEETLAGAEQHKRRSETEKEWKAKRGKTKAALGVCIGLVLAGVSMLLLAVPGATQPAGQAKVLRIGAAVGLSGRFSVETRLTGSSTMPLVTPFPTEGY
jgi:hypothetical protein